MGSPYEQAHHEGLTITAQYSTPEGDVVVWREPTISYGVRWLVDVPGLGRHQHGTKRAAMQHAAGAVRLLTPLPPGRSLLAAWDKVRTYA